MSSACHVSGTWVTPRGASVRPNANRPYPGAPGMGWLSNLERLDRNRFEVGVHEHDRIRVPGGERVVDREDFAVELREPLDHFRRERGSLGPSRREVGLIADGRPGRARPGAGGRIEASDEGGRPLVMKVEDELRRTPRAGWHGGIGKINAGLSRNIPAAIERHKPELKLVAVGNGEVADRRHLATARSGVPHKGLRRLQIWPPIRQLVEHCRTVKVFDAL